MFKRFLIYGIIGWGMEIIWTSLDSLRNGDMRLIGYSNFWMLFIYGMAVFLEPLHDVMKKWNIFLRGSIWVVLIWGIEYSSGLLLNSLLGVYPWFYSDRLAVDGLVTLSYAPAWFLAGLIFERVHASLDAYAVK